MTCDLRWVLVLLANLLLILLVAEVNHYLALLSLHVFAGGLLLTFGILRLQLRQGLIANGVTALVLDALNPFSFGLTFLLIVVCHTVVFSLRGNFARESVRAGLLVALGINLVLIFAYTILASGGVPKPGIYLGRVSLELLLSTVFVIALTPWFLALQKTALAFIGIDLDAEQREAQ
jgi:hypothetical protein